MVDDEAASGATQYDNNHEGRDPMNMSQYA